MFNELFVERNKISVFNVEDALTDTVFPASASFIDAGKYSRVAFVVALGAVTDALTFQVKQDTSATQTANIKNVTGAVQVCVTTDDDKFLVIEVDSSVLDTDNSFRYVTLAVSGVLSNNYAAIIAVQYGDKMPVSQGTLGTDYVGLVSVVSG